MDSIYEALSDLKDASDNNCWIDVSASWGNSPSIAALFEYFEFHERKILLWKGNRNDGILPPYSLQFDLPEGCNVTKARMDDEFYCEFTTDAFYCCVHMYPKI